MVCVVLAAGYATRLYPLTENFPKPLLPVGEKTILDWLLDDIDSTCPVDRHVIVSNHKFIGHFEQWTLEKHLSAPIHVLDDGSTSNETRLGAVKDIQFAIDALSLDDDLLVIAGDNVLDFSLHVFCQYAEDKKATCVMRYYEPSVDVLRKTGVALIDENERIIRMEEKPSEPFANWSVAPFYYYSRRDIHFIRQAIESDCNTDAPGSMIAWLSNKSPVYAMEMPGMRYDIGNIASYQTVQDVYKGIIHQDEGAR